MNCLNFFQESVNFPSKNYNTIDCMTNTMFIIIGSIQELFNDNMIQRFVHRLTSIIPISKNGGL